MTIPLSPRSSNYFTDSGGTTTDKIEVQVKKPDKTRGLPMQYVSEDELDKVVGSIRIEL